MRVRRAWICFEFARGSCNPVFEGWAKTDANTRSRRWTRSRSLSQMKWKLSFAADIAILGIGRVVEVSGKANRPQARPIPRYRVTILFSLPSLSTLFFSRGSVFAAALTGYESTPHRTSSRPQRRSTRLPATAQEHAIYAYFAVCGRYARTGFGAPSHRPRDSSLRRAMAIFSVKIGYCSLFQNFGAGY